MEESQIVSSVLKACKDFGLDFDFPPTIVEFLDYDISEIANYNGFPVRYPHWRWGEQHEELVQGYAYGADGKRLNENQLNMEK